MTLRLTTPPTTLPITVAVAKDHLRYTASDQDDTIETLIGAAREYCESHLDRSIVAQSWTLTLDDFPGNNGEILLRMPPVQSVTSITYYDDNGDQQTLSSSLYQIDTSAEPARLAPARNENWPSVDNETLGAVSIEYVAGYTTIPVKIIHAIKLLVHHWFWNLGATTEAQLRRTPIAVQSLLNPESLPMC